MAATVRDGQKPSIEDSPFDLRAGRGARPRVRVPELLVGTLLVALFALGGAWLYANATSTERYVRIRQDIERGQAVAGDDLAPVELQLDGAVRAVPWSQASSLVGQVAVADIRAGTLATADAFAGQTPIPAGSAVVAIDLDAGVLPALRAGDLVQVVSLPGGGDRLDGELATVVADRVPVVDVVANGGRRTVSLVLGADEARRVAVADVLGEVRLLQVPEG